MSHPTQGQTRPHTYATPFPPPPHPHLCVPNDMPGAGLSARGLVTRVAYVGVELIEQNGQGLSVPQVAAKVLHSPRGGRLRGEARRGKGWRGENAMSRVTLLVALRQGGKQDDNSHITQETLNGALLERNAGLPTAEACA